MRAAEVEYWNHVAEDKGDKDNIYKRCEILRRVMRHAPVSANILEIGAGQALIAALTNLATLGHINYQGTDVSDYWCRWVAKRWRLEVAHTDIKALPDCTREDGKKWAHTYDMIWAFDSLEHVHPEDRQRGYGEIHRVLGEHGTVLINMPLSETLHDTDFDHAFGIEDIERLCQVAGLEVSLWEKWGIEHQNRYYGWVELVR